MPVLTAQNLSKSYGAEDIFSGITLSIAERARIGMVGSNGGGKTTLLRILIGEETPSSGIVLPARGLRIGYLPQEADLDSALTLWEESQSAFADLKHLQADLHLLEARMAHAHTEQDMEDYARMTARFERMGGYTYENTTLQTLTGLGFEPSDYHRPIAQLSGGQRTRACLARLLLTGPDLLLLDEPTNHLDIQAIEWLEAYLKDWDGAVLVVSHDRYFLDQVTTTIWEMTPALETYRGNYSAYLQQREERYARRLEEYQAQQEFIEKEEEYIRRNIAGQNTRQAQGRRKRLSRLLEEARLAPPHINRRLHLRLEPTARSGDLVLRTHSLSIGYADEGRPLFDVPDLTLRRGECAAILGPNGAGKTTFLKTILEQIPPYAGEAQLGASLQVGYFAQAHEGLRPERTLMDEINAVAPNMLPAAIRDYLAKFLFTGDDVFKQVNMLSGGERGRLALACLALQGANLLLLDEPTNHLDLPSQEVLQSILGDFTGTILLVSHDRYLIDNLATQVWEVLPEDGRLRVFSGTYSEYRASLQAQTQPTVRAAEDRADAHPTQAKARQGLSKYEIKRRQERIHVLESEITAIESELARVTARLENPPADAAAVQRLGQDYNRLQQRLETHMEEWTRLSEEISASGV